MVRRSALRLSHLPLAATLCMPGCALPEYEKVDHSPRPNEPVAVATGAQFSGVVFRAGQVKLWGANESGQLGTGSTSAVGDGPGELGNNLWPVSIHPGFHATALAAGGAHVCALSDEYLLKCWGNNSDGQLGIEVSGSRGLAPGQMADFLPFVNLTGGKRPSVVAAGGRHTCARLADGRVKCWGDNEFGQLGLGDTNDRGAESGSMGQNLPEVLLGSSAKTVTAGETHSCALLNSGRVKCWGNNAVGQLGIGDTENRGDGSGEMGGNLPEVPLDRNAKAVVAGGKHTCAILDNNSVQCWGYNQFGQLGVPPADSNLNRGDQPGEVLPVVGVGSVKAIAAGYEHTCAILESGQVQCWGQGQFGQAGNTKGEVQLGGREAVVLALGPLSNHGCAILDNGAVRCWGSNDSGQLGLGTTAQRNEVGGEVNVGNP